MDLAAFLALALKWLQSLKCVGREKISVCMKNTMESKNKKCAHGRVLTNELFKYQKKNE